MLGLTKLHKIQILPRWLIVLIDLSVIVVAVMAGYLLRFNFEFEPMINWRFHEGVGTYMLASLVSTAVTRSYSGIIRYTGLQDGIRVIYSSTLTVVLVALFNYYWSYNFGSQILPSSVIIIAYFLSVLFLTSYRVLVKVLFAYYANVVKRKKLVMIFGAGDSGIMTRSVLEGDRRTSTKVVGFLEDDQNKVGKVLNGIGIFNAKETSIEDLLKHLRIEELVIAVQLLSIKRKNELVDICIRTGVTVRHVPPVQEWVHGQLSVRQIREVNIEDLLGRESIQLDNYYVKKELGNKRVLITGAAGSIGGEIVRQVVAYSPSLVILLDQSETGLFEKENELEQHSENKNLEFIVADITDRQRLSWVFETYRPQIVFHAAAYKHVPLMEGNPVEAVQCNVKGTRIVADLSREYGIAKFVMISTDKAVNPTSVMGASKRVAEMYVQALNNVSLPGSSGTKYITTRFGNVLGSNGSVIPLFKKQISHGGPVTVTHPDITRFFMTIPEACQLVLEAGAMGEGGEIFIFDMGKSLKIVDLAKRMIRLSGLNESDIDIVYTGLRDGEKLFEELLNTTENTVSTHHKKIMIAKVVEEPFFKVTKDIEELFSLAEKQDEIALVQKIKIMVPDYKSNSSRFEKLDTTHA